MRHKKIIATTLLSVYLTGLFPFAAFAADPPAGGAPAEGEQTEDLEYDYTALLESIQQETKNLNAVVKEIKESMEGKASSSITGVGLINSSNRLMDYKPGDTSFMDNVKTRSDIVEELNGNNSRYVGNTIYKTGNAVKDEQRQQVKKEWLYWLINHNQYERYISLNVSQDGSKSVNYSTMGFIYGAGNQTAQTPAGTIISLREPLQPMGKGDFLMNMYKAIYGPICSRAIEYQINSVRSGRVMGGDESYSPDVDAYYQDSMTGQMKHADYANSGWNFSEGDHYFAVTSNVKELYFKELIDMGILVKDEVRSTKFHEEYAKYAAGDETYPVWDTLRAPYNAFGMRITYRDSYEHWNSYSEPNCPWGEGFTMTEGPNYTAEYDEEGNKIGQHLTSGAEEWSSISPTGYCFFANNDYITGIEALRYVEKILRMEEDMTDTEAQIIAYKYGVNYLNKANEEDRKTLTYLVAKGIISFEDESDFSSIYIQLTKEFAFRILYRLANESARTTFKDVQLTDSDNFWIKQDFGQNNLKFVVPVRSNDELEVPNVYTTEVKQVSDAGSNPNWIKRIFTSVIGPKEALAASNQEYTVTKTFTGDSGALLYNLFTVGYLWQMTNGSGGNAQCPTVVSVVAKERNTDNVLTSVDEYGTDADFTITFKIKADSEYTAALAVDSNLSYDFNGEYGNGAGSVKVMKVAGVSKVKSATNNTELTLVPATSLKDISSELVIVQDKMLKNSKTNTTAVLLPDSNMALIGNQVIKSESVMLKGVDGVVYYDLEVIKALLSQTYVSSLDSSVVYAGNALNEETTPVYIDNNETPVAKTFVTKMKSKQVEQGDQDIKVVDKNDMEYYNLTLASQGKNNIVYNYTGNRSGSGQNNALSDSITVIVDFQYYLPRDNRIFTDSAVQSLTGKSLLSNDLTIGDVSDMLMKRPDASSGDTKSLADWWDANIYLSNAITQVIYGANDGAGYVKCGYLVPNIYFLYKDDDVSKGLIKSFLEEVDGYLPQSYKTAYVHSPEFDLDTGNDISSLCDGMPDFVSAMYNNSKNNQKADMWKQFNENRRIYLCKGEAIENGSTVYYGAKINGGNFVITASGAVYRSIEDDETVTYTAKTNGTGMKLVFSDRLQGSTNSSTNTAEGTWCTRDGVDFMYAGMDGSYMRFVGRTPTVGFAYYSPKQTTVNGRPATINIHALMSLTRTGQDQGQLDYTTEANMFKHTSLGGASACLPYHSMLKNNKLWASSFGITKSFIDGLIQSKLYDYIVVPESNQVKKVQNGNIVSFSSSSYDENRALSRGPMYETVGLGPDIDNFMTFRRVDIWDDDGIPDGTYYPTRAAGIRVVEVSSNFFKINADKEIVERYDLEFMNKAAIYPSSINQGMMDAMMSNEIDTKRIGDLAVGEYLYINGALYYKTDKSTFTSFPISDSGLLADIDTTILQDQTPDVQKAIVNYFSTIPMSIRGLGVMSPLSAYIKSADLGYFNKNVQTAYKNYLTGNMAESHFLYDNMEAIKKGGIACAKNSNYMVDADGGNNTTAYANYTGTVKSAIVKLELDPDLMCRLFDANNHAYSLMLSVPSLSEGYLLDLPFYEDLDLTNKDMLSLNSRKVHFRALEYANEIRNQFLEDHRAAFAGDLKKLFKITCIDLMMYVIVMSWVGYAVLRYGVFYGVLETIHKPFANSTKGGIDLLKIFTLGIYNMDSEPNFVILFGGNVLLVFMTYLIFTYL